jgi:hypothetical protein
LLEQISVLVLTLLSIEKKRTKKEKRVGKDIPTFLRKTNGEQKGNKIKN